MVQHIGLFVCLTLSTILFTSCEEEYNDQPPFTAVSDTTFLDVDNWFFMDIEPIEKEGASLFPFVYDILDRKFDGYLLSSGSKIYLLDGEKSLNRRSLFLDLNAAPGDTLDNPNALQYLLLLDRKFDGITQDEVFYLLKRSRKGVSSFQERSIWVISPQKGLLAVADYDIDQVEGKVRLEDVIGEPDYFKDQELFKQLKRYDHRVTYYIDQDRYLIYEFDKYKGIIKSRNYVDSEDLHQYEFPSEITRVFIDFRIRQKGEFIILEANNECYTFSDALELLESGDCL